MAGTRTYHQTSVLQMTELMSKNLPRQESNHESKPCEEENTSIFVEGVENWNRSSLSIDWINLRRLPKSSDSESHDW
jgi:hypothetical protein